MNYEVIMGPEAIAMLAEIWVNASDRTAVSRAAFECEHMLSRNPLAIGESRASSTQRVAYYTPLGFEFEVIEDDKRVVIQGIFATRR